MQLKKSAGIFLAGLILSAVGGVLSSMAASAAAAASMAASLSRYAPTPSAAPGVMALIFGLISLAGFVMLCIGAYRALVKIDALPIPEAPLPPSPRPAEAVAAPAAE